MQSQNSFSINLKQQKAIAKKRLKAIRQSDHSALEQVKKFHSQPDALSFNTIQLADVQHALARELGLPSWSKLKAHVENLESHKRAISLKGRALDHDLSTLHVRCGHDIQQRLVESGFEGHFLPMIDPLCIGPIPNNEQSFLALRAHYVASTLLPVMGQADSVQDIVQQGQRNLDTLLNDKFERIVFWVEHDSYDQLMLLRCLTYLEDVKDKVIEIIELNQFPGTERFIGFGQLPVEAIRSCWQYRKPLSTKLMSQAKRCWHAVTSENPNAIVNLLQQHELDSLPNIRAVLIRHLQELPHSVSGLSSTQRLALDALKDQVNNISVINWFQLYQQREPLPYLGDVMFYALMMPLVTNESPLITIDSMHKNWWEQQVSITQYGKHCLEGKAKFTQEYWVGGIRNNEQSRWVWDHLHLSTLSNEQHSYS
ncbi:DUF1835 domain-containing protein [Vibrio sp. YIC-376]|uniref:DUF1835 domain-containing protein n=1 Tax=Vibrio sp. YIC-376 TaxID=3136162 RepID=UPI00402AFD19